MFAEELSPGVLQHVNVNVGVDIRTPNGKNDEDQSEANDWIIFDFSEVEATARRSA